MAIRVPKNEEREFSQMAANLREWNQIRISSHGKTQGGQVTDPTLLSHTNGHNLLPKQDPEQAF
ncbi:MAG TPA: hypothetical protein PLA50_20745, partial [Bacteroidia bacterium]|nr:hypothetical protein [Bacteroidia bacterium]